MKMKITGIGGPVQVDPARKTVTNTSSPENFSHELYVHGGNLTFRFDGFAPNEDCTVSVGFAELFYSRPGSRLQDMLINGVPVLTGFDILAEGAPYSAVVKEFKCTADNEGTLIIDLKTANNNCADLCNLSVTAGNKSIAFVAGTNSAQVRMGDTSESIPVSIEP